MTRVMILCSNNNIYNNRQTDMIKKFSISITKSKLKKLSNVIKEETNIKNEFNELKGITDEDDKHYELLNVDSNKNRYNDIKPCKHYL